MKTDRDIREQYQRANVYAARSLQKDKKQVLPVCPAMVNILGDDRNEPCRLDLGVLDIPANLIVGVAEPNCQSLLYTKEFLPIPSSGSRFADHWSSICEMLLCHEESRNEISCYEYLGASERYQISRYSHHEGSCSPFDSCPDGCEGGTAFFRFPDTISVDAIVSASVHTDGIL